MKIDGFTMGKNASKLFYPMKQSIMSILPIVDTFIVVLGRGDEEDNTRKEIESINSPKIKIIDTDWDIEKYPKGMEHAHQTDIAKSYCTGDWLFYLQADEVIHEKDLSVIQQKCRELLDYNEVEGLVFNYLHFWGDYWHLQEGHCWYREEIRIIRNNPEIHSWQSAQSFRKIPEFDGLSYRRKKGTIKLKVAKVNADVYHYGWVRPPELMQKKNKSFITNHIGKKKVEKLEQENAFTVPFDYGNMNRLNKFSGSHPAVMNDWINKFNWDKQLRKTGRLRSFNKLILKHDMLRYRIISWVEKYLLFDVQLGGFRNFIQVRKKKLTTKAHKGISQSRAKEKKDHRDTNVPELKSNQIL